LQKRGDLRPVKQEWLAITVKGQELEISGERSGKSPFSLDYDLDKGFWWVVEDGEICTFGRKPRRRIKNFNIDL